MLNSLNFSWLARISTPRRPILKGLLPSIGSILALLATALVISASWWLWTGATATAALFLPFYAKTFFAVCGLTVLNFLFSREIHHATFACREVREGFVFDKENPTDLRKLVNHLRCELNAYFREKYGDRHVDMPMPRLLTFADPHFEMETVEGMTPWHSAILFSSGVFNSHETGMNQQILAAQISAQLVKIYMHRGSSNIIVKMGVDLLSSLEMLQKANWLTRFVSIFTWPLQFLFLVERSLKRAYEYEAAEVVASIGRGMNYIEFLDKKACMSLAQRPTTRELRDAKAHNTRPPYEGRFKFLIGPIYNWIAQNLELPEDNHNTNILIVAISGLVRESLFHINELWAGSPRGTRLKEHLRTFVGEDRAYAADLTELYRQDKQLNRRYYEQIEPGARYDVVGPDGDGIIPSIGAHHHHDHQQPVEQSIVDEVLNQSAREVLHQHQAQADSEEHQPQDDSIASRVRNRRANNRH